MEKNIFEIAARKAFRFPSNKGDVSVEDLFNFNLSQLDNTARAINKELKSSEEESFVTTRTNANTALAVKLEIVKFVIADKQEEQRKRVDAVARREQKEQVASILAARKHNALQELTTEQLAALHADLSAE